MTLYNIYYGTIGKTLKVKYRFTRNFKNEQEALKMAKDYAKSLYLKNEGKYNIPDFDQITEESELTGLSIETLYEDHIKDITRYYVIPTEMDTIPKKKLRW